MAQTVLGIFSDTQDAENALSELEENGFNPKDISIVMRDQREARKVGENTGAKVTAGAVSGATTGGILGALVGFVVATGILPGIGAIFIGGPLAAALGLTGAAATTVSGAATGVVAGGLLGALMSLGLSKNDAEAYQESIMQGGILVAVPAMTNEATQVRGILEDNGADKIRSIESESEVEFEGKFEDQQSYPYQTVGAKGGKSKRRNRDVEDDYGEGDDNI